MKILTFSRFFPKGHIREGQPTFFVEQIWKGFYQDGKCPDLVDKWIKEYTAHIPEIGSYNNAGIKGHTIRAGNRWKVGDKFSARVWSGAPYRSKQVEFAQLEVKKVWKFEIVFDHGEYADDIQNVFKIDEGDEHDLDQQSELLQVIAQNDGLTIEDFISWFSIHPKGKGEYNGQIISWDEKITY